MSKIKSLPVKTDELGSFQETNCLESELIYLSLGVDGAERRSYEDDSFSQGSESDFDMKRSKNCKFCPFKNRKHRSVANTKDNKHSQGNRVTWGWFSL